MQFVAKQLHGRGCRITLQASFDHYEDPRMKPVSTLPRRRLLLAAGAIALAAPLAASAWSIGSDTVQGSGNIGKQACQVAHFSGLAVDVPGKVELHVGTTEGVSIEADDNILPLVETVVENDTLHIRPVRENLNLHPRTLRVTVNARQVDHLSLAGSGSVRADALRGPKLKVALGGSGSIVAGTIDGDELAVRVAGSGSMSAGAGAVRKVSVSVAGSGNVDLGKVKAGTADVSSAGSGDTRLWAQDTLNVKSVGSGDVSYYGDPKVSRQVVGSGEVRRAGAAGR
jgi:hypothetical protein